MKLRAFFGELSGTFILVFFGCGSVAVSTLFSALSLFEVSGIWAMGVFLGILISSPFSTSHLNPAVTLAMAINNQIPWRFMPVYFAGQFSGAFIAAAILYFLFGSSISQFEAMHEIVRGELASVSTASMFGEFYAPLNKTLPVSMPLAFCAEAAGTFLLVLMIFVLGREYEHHPLLPLFIGLTVASLICLIAPLTQAGFNPARDLSPRIFSYFAGWKSAALPDSNGGIVVYVLGPFCGAAFAAWVWKGIVNRV